MERVIDVFYSSAFLACMLIVMSLLAGCGVTKNNLHTGGSGSPSITMSGSPTGTWNQPPHGGIDEKSNSSPKEPVD